MNSKTNNKKETVGGKMKRILILFSFIWIIFLTRYFFILEQKGTKELSKMTLNEKNISFVVEDGEVYIYLKDLIGNGFILDEETSGSRQDKSIYRYVLWTNDLCDDVVCIENIEAFTLPQKIEIQVYINGLQISCYVLDEELLLNLEEFASVSFQKWSLSKKQSFTGTMICDAEGNQHIIDELNKDAVFGEPFLLPTDSQHYYVCATEETRVMFIDYEHVIKRCEQACHHHSQMVSNLLQLTAIQSRQQNERIYMLSRSSTRKKLMAYLNALSTEKHSKDLKLPMSYTALAQYLSVDRSAMTRELKNLEEEGIIKKSGKQIHII